MIGSDRLACVRTSDQEDRSSDQKDWSSDQKDCSGFLAFDRRYSWKARAVTNRRRHPVSTTSAAREEGIKREVNEAIEGGLWPG